MNEYDFLNYDVRLGPNIALLGYGGSRAYGTSRPDSDIDIRGCTLRTMSSICLGKDFGEVKDENTDTVIYSYDKMLKLLSECNPNTVEMLGLRPQDYIRIAPAGQILLDNKELFLSQICIRTFGEYASKQLYKLKQKTLGALPEKEVNAHIARTINNIKPLLESKYGIRGINLRVSDDGLVVDIPAQVSIPAKNLNGLLNEITSIIRDYDKNSTRNEKAIKHGKIDKHGMHVLRILMTGIDLLEKGEIITYREDEHDLLMAIRNGEFEGPDGLPNRDFYKLVDEYDARFQKAAANTKLPVQPDYEKISYINLSVNNAIVKETIELGSYDDIVIPAAQENTVRADDKECL